MLKIIRNSKDILGMNTRNKIYVDLANGSLANNKLATKKILKQGGVPVSKTIRIIKNRREIELLKEDELPDSFVLKPNHGFGGEGIVIVYGRKKKSKNWIKAEGDEVTLEMIKNHCRNIIDGSFSLSSSPDKAFFEERIRVAPFIKHYSFRGIPDVRLVNYNKVPTMAMLRLPTKRSRGRSNVHQGGIGVGIDIATGITTTAVLGNRQIDYLPGTRLLLSGIQIPFWNEILHMATKAQILTNIKFLGVDVAIDRERGPIITELNARPGLAIQLANLSPLGTRLKRIKGLKIKTAKRGVRIAQDLFGGEVEDDIEEKSGKKVIGVTELIGLLDQNGNEQRVLAKIDTGAYRTTICTSLAKKLQLDKIVSYKRVRGALGEDERPIISLSFIMDKYKVVTEGFIAPREDMKYDMIIGRRDLKKYLIDPNRKVYMSRESLNRKLKKTKKEQLGKL